MTPVIRSFLVFVAASPIAAQELASVVRPEPVGARLMDAFQVRKRLGVSPEYDAQRSLAEIKIAVLDFGFDGYDPARKQLPASTVVVENYPEDFVRTNKLGDPGFTKSFAPGNNHGRLMAQVVWATTNFGADGPKFYLLNANGPTMFRRAVSYAIQEKVDVMLFCSSFEGIGNFDGKGPINAVVDEAVRAGIIWVNAAGNFGRRTYNGPVTVGENGFLQFAGGRDFLRVRNNLDENTLTITLNWNSYGEVEDAGTLKDLDLFVQDPNGNTIGKSDLVQAPMDAPATDNQSKNPRERVVLTDLPSSRGREYLIRIRAASKNWEPTDRLRVLVTAQRDAPYVDPATGLETSPVEFIDATGIGEVFPPADNPRVITVGDASASSAVGPTTDFRVKPDILIEDSQTVFSNGESSYGSSNAAAYFTGVVCLLKATEPNLTAAHLLKLATSRKTARTTPATTAASSPTARRTYPIGRSGVTISTYSRTSGSSTPVSLSRALAGPAGSVIAAVQRYDAKLQVSQTSDGRYVISVDRSPPDLVTLFPRFPQERARVADDYEFFLALDRGAGTAKVVDYFRRKNTTDPAPWQAVGGKATDWVEVRKQTTATSPVSTRLATLLANRVWKTPTKAELRAVVGVVEPVAAATKSSDASPPPPPKPGFK